MKNGTRHNVVELVEQILTEAVQSGASDVHFEPTASQFLIKFRLDGCLKTVETLPKAIAENVISRLKVMGNLLTYRNDVPQEGRIEGVGDSSASLVAGSVSDKRLATFPTIHGQRAVVRFFYENDELMDIEKLGLNDYIETALKTFAGKPAGILLLTGPAGSGKSTTLAALLGYLLSHCPGRSIVTLEDPVERAIEGVTQVQIEPFGQMSFPVALRSLLRQDPQVLMIGEVRDAQTAQIVIEAGLTGHLLMTTMHSGSCCGALLRLLEMGIEPYQITSGVYAVLNQRLIRKLCPHCKRALPDGSYEAVGCPACFQTGYRGRTLLAELVEMDGQLRKAVLDRCDMDSLEQILKNRGNMNLIQEGRRMLIKGITSQDELNRVCGG